MTKETMNHLSIIDQIVPVITGMWAVVNGPGSSNRLHSHPYNNMSGVFYLQVPKDSGALVFLLNIFYNFIKIFAPSLADMVGANDK